MVVIAVDDNTSAMIEDTINSVVDNSDNGNQPENAGNGNAVQDQNQTHVHVDENGTTIIDGSGLIADIPISELSAEEERSLLFTREEEKLARDVYLALDEMWSGSVSTFGNIANAEQTHTDSVKALLDRYSLEDPVTEAEDLNLGVFQNEDLQNLYNALVEQGSQSLVDALIVGATIEDLDIRDIELDMESVDNEDILIIYESLVKGSENHMRAFVNGLENQDSFYNPVYITDERYETILESEMSGGESSATQQTESIATTETNSTDHEIQSGMPDDFGALIEDINSSDLSEEEDRSLLFIREEEKLARDVYLAMNDVWGTEVQVFAHISDAEQTHTDSVKVLLERYSLEDPVTEEEDLNLGVFENEELQSLYDDLVETGSQSLENALIVGATIEDLDIYDIENEIAKVDNEDIIAIYEVLVDGSENHMRAFTNQLTNIGGSYTPQYISVERYEFILSTENSDDHNMTTTESSTDTTVETDMTETEVTPETNSTTQQQNGAGNGNGNGDGTGSGSGNSNGNGNK